MKINNIFKSIQGEGKYVGTPMLFIRLSGCNRNCSWCDTKYHKKGIHMSTKEIVRKIKKSKVKIIVWTGGEPLLQEEEIVKVIFKTNTLQHHLETNGDLIARPTIFTDLLFDYICISPKNEEAAQVDLMCNYDIKVVTDLKLNKNLIKYASILMPLTTYNKKKDLEIKKKVWDYCIKNNIKYSPRIQVDIWGKKRGV
jgi:7-carboxy-7-deazaguanine synthase